MHDAHTRKNPTRTVGGIARIRVKMVPWVGVVGQETVKVGHLGGLKEIAKNVIYAQRHCIPLVWHADLQSSPSPHHRTP